MELTVHMQCPKCKADILETAYFCSNCGRSLRSKPEDTSIVKQIFVYFVSLFLAPFGLGYAFKYLRQTDRKARMIGVISLILTVVAIIAVVVISTAFLEQQYSAINAISGSGL